MPIHDWTRIFDGAFHDFHLEWISALKFALNEGILPRGYYAAAEQKAGEMIGDVLVLEQADADEQAEGQAAEGGVAVLSSPPRARYALSGEPDFSPGPRSRIVIRHRSHNTVVAVIEIVSSGNKASQRDLDAFVYKAVDLMQAGIHLLVIDLYPPTSRDPDGIHGVIWQDLCKLDFDLPKEKPLTLAAYSSGKPVQAFIETVAVGDSLPDMALFLTPDDHVLAPLEKTYCQAFARVPKNWRKELERQA